MEFNKLKLNHDIRQPFPKFSRPQICGVFSVDSQRCYRNGMENLKYLNIPKNINFNLNLGDDKYLEKPNSSKDEKIKHLLAFIMNNRQQVITNERVNADFVCFRGLLKVIMCTPYEKEDWIIVASKFKGTIYLCAVQTEQKKNEILRQTEKDIKFTRYGHKFENYVLSKNPNELPAGNNEPTIESEEFCIMFSTKIANNLMLYGAEIDGVESKEEIKSLEQLRKVQLVEVKVKRRESNERQKQNFYRFKSRNYWSQSYLVGIERLFVGIRDDSGIVEEVKPMTLRELYEPSQRNNFWHPTVCINFLNDFLETVKRDMQKIADNNDSSIHTLKYEWKSNSQNYITCQRFDQTESLFTNEFLRFMNSL